MQNLEGGAVFTVSELEPSEYLPNRGVFLTNVLGKARGDAFGLYRGRIVPGSEIATEIHSETSETVIIVAGEALGFIEDQEIPLSPGQVLHVNANVNHGLRNVGDVDLEFIVIGHPDF